jgi:hypothetical protein
MRAKDLRRGDRFMMQANAEVLATETVVDGKRVKLKLSLEDGLSIEFTDAGHVAELLCRLGRQFCVYRRRRDDDDNEPVFDPSPDLDLVTN